MGMIYARTVPAQGRVPGDQVMAGLSDRRRSLRAARPRRRHWPPGSVALGHGHGRIGRQQRLVHARRRPAPPRSPPAHSPTADAGSGRTKPVPPSAVRNWACQPSATRNGCTSLITIRPPAGRRGRARRRLGAGPGHAPAPGRTARHRPRRPAAAVRSASPGSKRVPGSLARACANMSGDTSTPIDLVASRGQPDTMPAGAAGGIENAPGRQFGQQPAHRRLLDRETAARARHRFATRAGSRRRGRIRACRSVPQVPRRSGRAGRDLGDPRLRAPRHRPWPPDAAAPALRCRAASGQGWRSRLRLRALDLADIGQFAIALGIIDAVADDETSGMMKPMKSASPPWYLAPRRLVEQGAGPDARRTVLLHQGRLV